MPLLSVSSFKRVTGLFFSVRLLAKKQNFWKKKKIKQQWRHRQNGVSSFSYCAVVMADLARCKRGKRNSCLLEPFPTSRTMRPLTLLSRFIEICQKSSSFVLWRHSICNSKGYLCLLRWSLSRSFLVPRLWWWCKCAAKKLKPFTKSEATTKVVPSGLVFFLVAVERERAILLPLEITRPTTLRNANEMDSGHFLSFSLSVSCSVRAHPFLSVLGHKYYSLAAE